MACRTIRLSGGRLALACGPGIRRPLRRCVVCNIPESMASITLCDYPTGQEKTCAAVVCLEHTRHVEPDTDYCPEHAAVLDTEEDPTSDACPYCGRLGNGEPCNPFCGADRPRHQHSPRCYDWQGLLRCGRVAGVADG